METIQLTKEKHKQIQDDMDQKIEMLTNEETEKLATLLNEKINLPFINEEKEKTIFVKLVKQMDRVLYQNLPNELYGLVRDVDDGISEEEAEDLKRLLAPILDKKIDIPYVPEEMEKSIFEIFISLIVRGMKKGYSVLKKK